MVLLQKQVPQGSLLGAKLRSFTPMAGSPFATCPISALSSLLSSINLCPTAQDHLKMMLFSCVKLLALLEGKPKLNSYHHAYITNFASSLGWVPEGTKLNLEAQAFDCHLLT